MSIYYDELREAAHFLWTAPGANKHPCNAKVAMLLSSIVEGKKPCMDEAEIVDLNAEKVVAHSIAKREDIAAALGELGLADTEENTERVLDNMDCYTMGERMSELGKEIIFSNIQEIQDMAEEDKTVAPLTAS